MNPEPYPATPAPAGSKFGVALADLLVAGGAFIVLLFSFGPVVGFSDDRDNAVLDHIGRSLWSWLSPLGIFVILATLLLLGTAAVDTWWHKGKAIKGGLHRHHLQVALALFVFVTILGMAFADPYTQLGALTVGFGIAWGGVLQLLGAIVAVGGAVLNYFDLLQNKITLPSSVSKPLAYQPPAQGASVDPTATTTSADTTTPLPPQNPPNA